ncbi:MAG: inorganic diphosphatase [Nitrospiraceae bacterium]|nr:inorganic diphosphatase [Nitrospiraceae bacterium]
MAFEVVIEIPKGSRIKYEIDHETNAVWLDRVLFTPMAYPLNYGYIEDTLGEDGDPLDALLILEHELVPGCHVKARTVGSFVMSDEKGRDVKLLCVIDGDPRFEGFQDVDDVADSLKDEISHFFAHYKDLEPKKFANVEGFADKASADGELAAAVERFGGGH